MDEPDVPRPSLARKRALRRGLLLAGANVVGVLLLQAVWFGREGAGSTGPWDLAFLVLLGLVAAPLDLLLRWASGRGAAVRALAGAACGPLAALGLLAAHAQVAYAFALWRGADVAAAMSAQGQGLLGVAAQWGEARAVLVAFAAPHAFVALARLFGLTLGGQLAVALPASLLASSLALDGFVGLPQVSWLIATPWLGPLAQSFLFLQPFVLPLVLPLVDAWIDPPA